MKKISPNPFECSLQNQCFDLLKFICIVKQNTVSSYHSTLILSCVDIISIPFPFSFTVCGRKTLT